MCIAPTINEFYDKTA